MRAAYYESFGPPSVLRIVERERPTPAEGEVLVRVHASTVTQTDCYRRRANGAWRMLEGIRKPRTNRRIPGFEFAGVVEALGPNANGFAVGDRVFGSCMGANAEYLCVNATGLIAPMPVGLSYEEAAAVCDGYFQAERALKRARVGQGTRLLAYGASGSCGTAAVQLAKHLGAKVTAVCNTENLDLVRSLGADEVIDYLKADFTRNGEEYDVLLDAVGKLSYLKTRGSLRKGGLWVATDGLQNVFHAFWTPWVGGRRLVSGGMQRASQRDVVALKHLIEAGSYRAVIDRVYPLAEVAAAHSYVDSWRKTGNVVISVLADGAPQ